MKDKQNYFFILIIILIILIGDLTLIREQKEVSFVENRTLQKFEHLTLKNYLSGSFQKNLENAMSDQFIASDTIKQNLKRITNIINANKIPKSICKNHYVQLREEYYSFDCNDSLITVYNTLTSNLELVLENRINEYNKLNKIVDTYYYVVPTASSYNFAKNDYSIDMVELLQNNMTGKYNLKYLQYENYDEYKKYFYKTDHHWNHVGTRMAYKDIISMIKPKDKLLDIEDEVNFENIIFLGSAARISQIYDYKEIFKVYQYDYPDMTTIVDMVKNNYGNEEKYFNGEFPENKLENHYANFYGDDVAEVVFNTPDSKGNLLIIGDSFTNSINKLVATHFNKTYDVDLRYYENTFNKEFNIKEYINENKIDKVLILVTHNVLFGNEFDIKGVE